MLRTLLDSLPDLPTLVMGQRMDVLAWNRAGSALLGDFDTLEPAARNIARITFLRPESRSLYADWDECARGNVAQAGRRSDNPRLRELIGELAMKSQEFRTWWAEHPVLDEMSGVRWRIEHDDREMKHGLGLNHGPHLARLAPPRHPRHRCPRLPHPPPARPQSPSTGLTLYQVLDRLQDLLSCWTGVCSTCQRPLPARRSASRTRQPAPT